ncbi:cysteine hydrolase family protein [Propionibacteriaceae bacterium G57]|uniref:cysteine hydrolase family protein n=1 Tax=Aestuariimicrobium sp. G57 TaxID=3418485 RepID=UPI003DA790EE
MTAPPAPGLPPPDQAWLVVVDHQRIFADPGSDWAAPRFAATIEPVRALAEHYAGRVVLTRWLPARDRSGSWKEYFEAWPFADLPDDNPLFDLVESAADIWAEGLSAATGTGATLDQRTFGKFGADLLAITGPNPHLVVVGVSTDCCVISTVLAAADAGAHVTVVADGCAGSSDENHQKALDIMGLYAPQVQVLLDLHRPGKAI